MAEDPNYAAHMHQQQQQQQQQQQARAHPPQAGGSRGVRGGETGGGESSVRASEVPPPPSPPWADMHLRASLPLAAGTSQPPSPASNLLDRTQQVGNTQTRKKECCERVHARVSMGVSWGCRLHQRKYPQNVQTGSDLNKDDSFNLGTPRAVVGLP